MSLTQLLHPLIDEFLLFFINFDMLLLNLELVLERSLRTQLGMYLRCRFQEVCICCWV